MPLIDVDKFVLHWALDPEIKLDQYQNALAIAESTVKRWVGATAYADACATEPTNIDRAASLRQAASLVAMAHTLPFLSVRAMPGGVVARLRIPDGTSIDDLTPEQLAALRANLLAEAGALIDPWRPVASVSGPKAGLVDPLNVAGRADTVLKEIGPRQSSRLPLM